LQESPRKSIEITPECVDNLARFLQQNRLYRSDRPITVDNIKQAELCFHGVLNNSVTIRGL
jgi:hypothetical protein